MKMSCYRRIKEYMESQPQGTVFAKIDFAGYGSDAAVRQALSRLVKDGVCRRVMPGVFCCPAYIDLFKEFASPDMYLTGKALARNYGWKVIPGPLIAQNQLGLSTQVPAQLVFTSTGPSREYRISGRRAIYFQRCKAKWLREMSETSATIVNALVGLQGFEIPDASLVYIGKHLSDEQKKRMVEEKYLAPKWMRQAIQIICDC